ncbi:tetratricopeptide repeat protein [Alphaproteobacteria bacterium]|nr:tetratricopeptide repeat protein [Alphaproteobacteria bacterium]
MPKIRKIVNQVAQAQDKLNDRERGHLSALSAFSQGQWREAGFHWGKVLTDYPHDSLALHAAHQIDFITGDDYNLWSRAARVLPLWNEDMPNYANLLGMYAFGLEETNFFSKAEEIGRRCCELDPRDAWGHHAVGHVLEMESRFDEGINWYESRRSQWADDSELSVHNCWHLALYYVEREDFDGAMALFDQQISLEEPDYVLRLMDATALLWRLHLRSIDCGDRWQKLADLWVGKIAVEGGFYAFNDFHAMLALMVGERWNDFKQLRDQIEAQAKLPTTLGAMARDVSVPLASAVEAYGRNRCEEAVSILDQVKPLVYRFGGSEAQRDAVDQFHIGAAIKGGLGKAALALAHERTLKKEESPLAWRFAGEAYKLMGDEAAAGSADQKAIKLLS